ncbi:hypothetical protein BWD42_07560 [Sphingobacterium sp. CZ-UAM]|uniref:hypothetical protein n=1 Tax=Sphingobacterium sp. CZ-UAM TaxID=1933868 RepID=UPI000985B38D|nr:hypothetical protein [Sphingobacterium sp. CZ-UAM]OOG19749.1 hypothetical protein BWD42_07560 [Sphingobacterium sp. CZ-UAM]
MLPVLHKINYGNEAWLKRRRSYSLLTLNSTGGWDTLAPVYSGADTVLHFSKIPYRNIYLLKDNDARKELERPFTIRKDTMIWY